MCLVGFGNTSQRMSKKVIDTLYSTCLALTDEMFDTTAKYVRDNSPFKMTFVSQTTNASVMYIPSAYGFIHGCYEAACTDCKPGTGEQLASLLVRMLNWTKQWRG